MKWWIRQEVKMWFWIIAVALLLGGCGLLLFITGN